MTWHHKVIWTEGMFLQPHHFQQHDRYLAAQQLARLTAVTPHARGWLSLQLDGGALALGKIALQSAHGLLPDGLAIDLPGDDPAPEALDVPPDARDELVVLALSLPRPGVAQTDAEGTAGAMAPRYRTHEADVPDDNAHAPRNARLQLGRPHLRLMLARDCVEGQAVLGVCRIAERRVDQRIVLDETYVPPTLDALRSEPLQRWMRELLGLLKQRGDALAARLTEPGRAGVGEIADYLLLGAINRHEPLLSQRLSGGLLHPRELHAAMVALAGDLAVFSDARRPQPLPAYHHDDPALCFPPLMAVLRQALSVVLEQGVISIPLQERKHGVRVALVPDVELQRQAQFVLAASARMPAEALRTRLPAQAKIGTVEHIRDLVNLQLPGVALRALPVAPRRLPFQAGFQYFELDTRDSEQWKQLAQSGGLAVHIGGEFPGLELELWAVRA